ncbi:MAG: hypothetical protein K0R38_6506 [Polyangiaceae bacterium]|jgi:hypothetical protein|nr:hypothetical protein [Polyangiaceae bacterium]
MAARSEGQLAEISKAGLPGRRPGSIIQPVCSVTRTLAPILKKLILLSVIIASVVVPARAARAKNGRKGLKKVLIQMAIFEIAYVFLLTQVWFRMA